MTCKGRAHQYGHHPCLALGLRQQPAVLLTSHVHSCLLVSADIVYRSGIIQHHAAVGVNGYPAEPKPSMLSAVDFTLRRLATYLLHGESLFWWCCSGAPEVVATSLFSSVLQCEWVSPAPCRDSSVLPGQACILPMPLCPVIPLAGEAAGKQLSAECGASKAAGPCPFSLLAIGTLQLGRYDVQCRAPHASWASCWLVPPF